MSHKTDSATGWASPDRNCLVHSFLDDSCDCLERALDVVLEGLVVGFGLPVGESGVEARVARSGDDVGVEAKYIWVCGGDG